MSNRLISAVYKARVGSPTRKAVLLYLANCLNEKTNACFPSITTIAKATEFHRDAVINAIKAEVEAGTLEVLRKGGPGKGSNRYAIHADKLVVESDHASRRP
jgi:Helix-turn-helix domain